MIPVRAAKALTSPRADVARHRLADAAPLTTSMVSTFVLPV